MKTSTIKTAFLKWLGNSQPITVIFSDQNAPRPNGTYVTIRLQSVIALGFDELREVDPNGMATFGGQREMSVSLNLFGTDALDIMHRIQASLSRQTVLDLFAVSGIAIIDTGNVLNLMGLLETKWEERAQMDVTIGFAENILDDLGIIETVELTGHHGKIQVEPTIISV